MCVKPLKSVDSAAGTEASPPKPTLETTYTKGFGIIGKDGRPGIGLGELFGIFWNALGNFFVPTPFVIAFVIRQGIWPTLTQGICCVIGVIVIVGYGMSVCLHRFFSHQAFKTSPWFAAVLGVLGAITNQGGILWWSSKHNRHHKFCDQPNDPHSWLQTSYMYSWIWWTLYEWKTDWQFVPRVYRNNKALVAINALHPVIIWSWHLFLLRTFGVQWTIWAYWIPSIISSLGSLDFNLQFHPKESTSHGHRYDENGKIVEAKGKNCKATDDPIRGDEPFIPKIIGEASHLDHHIHPRKSKRPGVDISYKFMIAPLEFFGLIWELQ